MESPLTFPQQQLLLRWVRAAMDRQLHQQQQSFQPPAAEVSEAFRRPHAVFVTLHKHGALRGCIGKMDFQRSLLDNALGAAVSVLEDPRFSPVQPDELDQLAIEISVLESPRLIPSAAGYDVTRHGIIVEQGLRSALFLPQVATEQGWTAEQTLAAVCEKAGLPPDAWRNAATRLRVFEAVAFTE